MSDKTPDNIKRHWHGSAGDRHEHLNVWTHGGSMGPANRAAWALTPEMMAAEAKRRVCPIPITVSPLEQRPSISHLIPTYLTTRLNRRTPPALQAPQAPPTVPTTAPRPPPPSTTAAAQAPVPALACSLG
jgi:hypothetical protein